MVAGARKAASIMGAWPLRIVRVLRIDEGGQGLQVAPSVASVGALQVSQPPK